MLNSEQQRAVEHQDGPLLVIAGAGSGKTRVVTTRICHLIEKGVDPSQILGLTFTNKAAQEMRERVRLLMQAQVMISTFHSLGAFILRESIGVLGYTRSFTIYDEEDVMKLLKGLVKELELSLAAADVKSIRHRISQAKNALISPEECAKERAVRPSDRVFPTLYAHYQERLKTANAVDFDDLLMMTVHLFREYPEVLEHYRDRWHYLLIDEYQDTNASQYELTRLLAHPRNNICVVGDPDQAIYSWRGADIHNILNFEKDFPNVTVVNLEQNYRSTETILRAANHLIEHNTGRFEKNLWSQLGTGEKIRLYRAESERAESAFVLDQIHIHQRAGVSLGEMVVFYRTNAQSRVFEDQLLSRKIPYTIVGGISFYARREIKDVFAFLRMIHSGADLVSFERTVNMPKRGIGGTTLERLRLGSIEARMGILDFCRDLTGGAPTQIKLSKKVIGALGEYVGLIDRFRGFAGSMPLSELIKLLIVESGFIDYLREEEETFDDRKENVQELVSKASEWEKENPQSGLGEFLQELALRSTLDETVGPEETLSLMTLHNGKGLEYRVVFLCGLEENLLPHANSLQGEEQMEEERRLCYVGMTRAKEILYITFAKMRFQNGYMSNQAASRFLREIPKEYIDNYTRGLTSSYGGERW